MSSHIIAPAWLTQGYEFPANVQVTECDDLGELPLEVISSAEFVILPYEGSSISIPETMSRLKSVKVIQTLTAGFDNVQPFVPAEVTLCNAAGVHDDATSELAVLLTLSVLRDMPRSFKAQQDRHWETYFSRSLAGKTVLLIGYGNVGKAAEKRLLGFGCKVIPVARTARDHVHAISDLPNLIPSADVVMLIVPNNPGTVNLVDAKFLASMKDDSVLVNVARGVVVDTDALMAELKTGRISAALDVTEPEPLPADHPLWSLPNVIITSHNGGEGDVFWERARTRIHSQFDLWLAGKPLECVITP
ncbi:MAG: 2-hydroxyacid dehydrogenase [Candidatus Nanopelagicales bacterium]|nr:2-hydroxyacid dehydrogenase [Candidatus Nanopelagicales bacterium]